MNVANVGNAVPRVREVLDAQGWLPMMEDHRQAAINIVREFYSNMHTRRVDSFQTWRREHPIIVTPTLIR